MYYLKTQYNGECIFCEAALRGTILRVYEHWIVIRNQFPYDKCFKNHRLLATKRHVTEALNQAEREELEHHILLVEDYNQCILNKKEDRSIPLHFHYHLVDIK